MKNIRYVRPVTVSLMLLLSALGLYFSADHFFVSQKKKEELDLFSRYISLSDQSLRAAFSLDLEFAQTQTLLQSETPMPEPLWPHSEKDLEKESARFAHFLSTLPAGLKEKQSALQNLHEKLIEIRPAIRENLSRPPALQDKASLLQWRKSNRDLALQLEMLTTEIDRTLYRATDLALDQLSQLSHTTYDFGRSLLEEARALASELILKTQTTKEGLDRMLSHRASALQTWQRMEKEILRIPEEESFRACLDQARLPIFSQYYPQNDETLRSLSSGQPILISLETYVPYLNQAFKAYFDLIFCENGATQSYIRAHTQTLERQMQWALTGMIAILLSSAALLMAQFCFFHRRLRQVLNRIHLLNDRFLSPHAPPPLQDKGDLLEETVYRLLHIENHLLPLLEKKEKKEAIDNIYEQIVAHAHAMIVTTDPSGKITRFNQNAEKTLGYLAKDLIAEAKDPIFLFDQQEIAEKAERLSHALGMTVSSDFDFFVQLMRAHQGRRTEQEWTWLDLTGKPLSVYMSIATLHDQKGYVIVATDISEKKRLKLSLQQKEREIGEQNTLFTTLLKTLPIGVYALASPSGKPLFANDRALTILGMKKDDMRPSFSAYKLPERVLFSPEEIPFSLGMGGVNTYLDHMLIVRPDGREFMIEVASSPVQDQKGQVWASLACLMDISERANADTEISKMAYLDYLTQLPNRRLFNDRLHVFLSKARRNAHPMALLSIDLDKFKPVNDNLGHAVGDLLLQAVAKRMQSCLRESDTLARVGGDEFMVILPSIFKEDDPLLVGEKIRKALNEPFELEGPYVVSIACCIGIAIYPTDAQNEKDLLDCADEAMYRAKRAGRNAVMLFAHLEEAHTAFSHEQVFLPPPCGNDIIDQGLTKLFENLFHDLNAVKNAALEPPKSTLLLEHMMTKWKATFSNEESELMDHGYPEYESHALLHQKIVAQLHEFSYKSAQPPTLTDAFLGNLFLSLQTHVIESHSQMAIFFSENSFDDL